MKVLLFCCKGFETMEFAPFVDVMGWARNDYDMPVEIVTVGFSKTVISTFGIPILVDKSIDEIDVSEYDALAIPGGFEEFGFYEEAYDERFLNLIREFESSNKFMASYLRWSSSNWCKWNTQRKKGYNISSWRWQKTEAACRV